MSSFSFTFILILLSCFCNLVCAWQYGPHLAGGLVGLIILILDIIAIVDVLGSSRQTLEKLLWILLIIFFPIGGLIIWILFGRKRHALI